MKKATLYYLRHSFVSLLLSAGLRRGEVAEQAGHSLAVMESTYAHVIAEFRGVPISDPADVIDQARVAIVRQRAGLELTNPSGAAGKPLQMLNFLTKPTRGLEPQIRPFSPSTQGDAHLSSNSRASLESRG